jgi:hypothetical protein
MSFGDAAERVSVRRSYGSGRLDGGGAGLAAVRRAPRPVQTSEPDDDANFPGGASLARQACGRRWEIRTVAAMNCSLALAAAVCTVAALGCSSAPREKADESIPGVSVSTEVLTQDHREGPLGYDLTVEVPVGGDHNPRWAACGVYATSVAPEYALHSMEHGAVWIAYDPARADASALRAAADVNPDYVLVAPVEGLTGAVVATAWGVQLVVDDAGDARVVKFVEAFAEGPQTPEPGAPCVGGGIDDPATLATVQ